ncbi:MAG: 50S ribosomal protein L7/L12 [Atopobium sp.]|nr:50S ribosomal protein L7/L12 [Atopobium sp.]
MAVTKDEIIEALKEMPALELSELVHELEDVFGVSAAAPVAVAAAPAAGGAAEEAEEKTNFDVVLEGFGDNKIGVIKVVRARLSSRRLALPSPLSKSILHCLLERSDFGLASFLFAWRETRAPFVAA